MKNLHFCTPELLSQINDPEYDLITTYRTGWVPMLYPGDVINLNQRDNTGKDTYLKMGKIAGVKPVKRKSIPDVLTFREELQRYNKKFHSDHYFFQITIYKLPLYKGLEESE